MKFTFYHKMENVISIRVEKIHILYNELFDSTLLSSVYFIPHIELSTCKVFIIYFQ